MAYRYGGDNGGYRADGGHYSGDRGRDRRYEGYDPPGPSRSSEPDYDYSDNNSYDDRRSRENYREPRRDFGHYDRGARSYPQSPEKRRNYSPDYDSDFEPRRLKSSDDVRMNTGYRRDDGGDRYGGNRGRYENDSPPTYRRAEDQRRPRRGGYSSSDESDRESVLTDYEYPKYGAANRSREKTRNRRGHGSVPYDDGEPDADYGEDEPPVSGRRMAERSNQGAGRAASGARRRGEEDSSEDLPRDYGSDSSGSYYGGQRVDKDYNQRPGTIIADQNNKRQRDDIVAAGLVGVGAGIAVASRGGEGRDNLAFEMNEIDDGRPTLDRRMGNASAVEQTPRSAEGHPGGQVSAENDIVSITVDDASSMSSAAEVRVAAGVVGAVAVGTAVGARRRLRRSGILTEEEELRAVLGDGRAAAKLRERQRAELDDRNARKAEGDENFAKHFGSIYRQTLKAQLETTPKEKLTGWKKFKHKRSKDWKRAQRRWREILGSLEIWRGSFKAIEGNFGTSVTSYFRFLKWLLGLNVFIMLLLFGVLILTQIFMSPDNFKDSLLEVNRTRYTEKAKVCTDVYDTYVQGVTNNHSTFDEVLDFFSGTGFMERTVLFYGYYFNKTYVWVDDTQQNYNMPVAYIMATTFYFLVSLVLMVKYTARGLKESQLNSGEKFYHSCNKVFCGWDFTLAEEKAAKYKQKNIYDEIMHDLQEQYLRRKQASRTTGEKCKLYSFRLFINIVVITILGSAGYLIYWTSMKTLELAEDPTNSGFETLLIQFLPSIAITVLNFIVPFVFEKVVVAEDYSAEFEVKLTIGRTVILRLASVAVLVLTLGIQLLDCPEEIEPGERCVSCIPNVYCWETYVGQQFFKLVILDFFVVIGVTFLVQYPRKFVVSRYSKYKVFEMVGHQEFEIPKNVLDLVYTQTLCWLGAFYSPLIPAISVLKMFFFFYTKKISLLQTCVPSRKSFRASNIQSFFMTILMLSIVLCIMPIVYTITRVPPSQSCGPFRVWDSEEFRMYEVIGSAVGTLPNVVREIMYFIGTWTFYIPLYIILCLFIYYYMAVAAGNRKMVELLKEQLALEGKDKQFLLGQVRDALMRGELNS